VIYIASKTVHAPKWIALRNQGAPFISTWIFEAGEGQSKSKADLWQRCIREASRAHALIAYREPGEIFKGAFIEIGAALASGKPVFLVGKYEETFIHHPLVTSCKTMEEAFTLAGRESHACKWSIYR
jgi:hypothetical protein